MLNRIDTIQRSEPAVCLKKVKSHVENVPECVDPKQALQLQYTNCYFLMILVV